MLEIVYQPSNACVGDGGRPSAAALQGEAANHHEVRRSRAGVLSVVGKGVPRATSGTSREGERERTTEDVSKARTTSKHVGLLAQRGSLQPEYSWR